MTKEYEINERVGEFIERVIPDDSYRIRIEANDMLPRKGTKSSLKRDNTMDLWCGGFTVREDGEVVIQGLFHRY